MMILAFGMALASTAAATPQDEALPLIGWGDSLRRLYRRAELVVAGRPGETVVVSDNDFDTQYRVSFTVEKVAKGKVDAREITILTSRAGWCGNGPAANPAGYPKNKSILTFLRWDARRKGWTPTANPHGAKELDEAGLAAYLLRMKELEAIPPEAKGAELGEATVEWVLRCIEHPATRAEGVMDLSYGNRIGSPKVEPGNWVLISTLTLPQRKRIVDALVAPHPLQYEDCSLFRLIADIPDERVETYLLGELKAQADAKSIRWGVSVIHFLSLRLQIDAADLVREIELAGTDEAAKVKAARAFLALAASRKK